MGVWRRSAAINILPFSASWLDNRIYTTQIVLVYGVRFGYGIAKRNAFTLMSQER